MFHLELQRPKVLQDYHAGGISSAPSTSTKRHIHFTLTYTASIQRLVVQHGRSIVEDTPAQTIEATATICRPVVGATHVVEDDRTF